MHNGMGAQCLPSDQMLMGVLGAEIIDCCHLFQELHDSVRVPFVTGEHIDDLYKSGSTLVMAWLCISTMIVKTWLKAWGRPLRDLGMQLAENASKVSVMLLPDII